MPYKIIGKLNPLFPNLLYAVSMKNWTDITANSPQNISLKKKAPCVAAPWMTNLDIIRVLLTGVYAWLGVKIDRYTAQRYASSSSRQAEGISEDMRAYLDQAETCLSAWSGDNHPHWQHRLFALSVIPDAQRIHLTPSSIRFSEFRHRLAWARRPRHHRQLYRLMHLALTAQGRMIALMRCGLSGLLCTLGTHHRWSDAQIKAPP